MAWIGRSPEPPESWILSLEGVLSSLRRWQDFFLALSV